MSRTTAAGADVAVIGGSGFYELLHDAESVSVSTPYGAPSDEITVGFVGDRRVAFVPRHGKGHRFPAHKINYRANLWALKSLGVRQVLAPCAVGSLRLDIGPGELVVPDQLVDRTASRIQTFYDEGAVHIGFADPYCPAGRRSVLKAAATARIQTVDGGTMVVIEGPRFSTRAESQWYGANGWSVINMTGHPEAVLARELALCYTSICLVTDHDAGVAVDSGVTQEEVFAVFAENIERLRALMLQTVAALPAGRECSCADALAGLDVPTAQL